MKRVRELVNMGNMGSAGLKLGWTPKRAAKGRARLLPGVWGGMLFLQKMRLLDKP
jgi:hypothetical protein